MQIEDYLYQKKLHEPLAEAKPTSMKVEDWALLDRQALGVVRLSLVKNVAYNVVNEKTTYDLFKALSNMYEKPSTLNKAFLIRKLVNTKMKEEGASVADHVNEFNSIISRLMSVDIIFDDEGQKARQRAEAEQRYIEIKEERSVQEHARYHVLELQPEGPLSKSVSTFVPRRIRRYIPGLKKRLISVGKLDEEGYHIGFEDQLSKVTKGSMVIAHGNKRKSLYMVEVPSNGINESIEGRILDLQKVVVGFCEPCVLGKQKKANPATMLPLSMTSAGSKEWNSGDDQLRFRWMIYPVVLADAVEGIRDAIGLEYWVASSSGWTKSLVLWAEIGESSLTGPEYVRPFEILERIGSVAYRLRLPEELSGVHDTFHVSNLKKCLAGASLHVPLDEIKVRWNSKRGPEFTWEREDYMKSKYPQLFVNRADEPAN
ncbi:hypothetical protein Tco_0439985 [Tanacetum coccineum]